MEDSLEAKLGSLKIGDEGSPAELQLQSEQKKTDQVAQEPDPKPPVKAKRTIARPSAQTTPRKSSRAPKTIVPKSRIPESADEVAIQSFTKKNSDRDVTCFRAYGNTISKSYEVKKIGEGTYSSVFALTRKSSTGKLDSQSSNSTSNYYEQHQTSILKMMPIQLPSQADHEGMTEPFYIANELQTMMIMDPIHGFIRYRGLLVVKGSWPLNFLQAFREFSALYPKKAENEDPETAFGLNQYYALIEMNDAGMEMNDIKRPSDFQIYDIFWQTAIHLANAETESGFEHRDLHVSNVCVKSDNVTGDGRIDVDKEWVAGMDERPEKLLGQSGLAVTIIDYTFSRVALPEDVDGVKFTNFREFLLEGEEYNDLCEKMATQSKRPKSGEEFENRLQSLTYAKVAKMVEIAHEVAEQQGAAYDLAKKHHFAPWENHVPRTNVAWLGYLISCLLGRAGKTWKTKYVAGSNALAKSMQDEMREKFLKMREVLMEEDLENATLPGSANKVVQLGIENGWITEAELDTFKERLERDS